MSEPEPNNDELFAKRAGELLNDQAQSLDGATRSRLNQARQAALRELDAPGRRRGWWQSGGLVLASVLLVVVWLGIDFPGGSLPGSADMSPAFRQAAGTAEPDLPSGSAGDLEVLMADEDLELLEELDFYNWLQSVPGGAVPLNETVG